MRQKKIIYRGNRFPLFVNKRHLIYKRNMVWLRIIFLLDYSDRMTHRSVYHQIELMTTLCVFCCFLSCTSRNALRTLNVFVRMDWGLQCRGWTVDKLRAGAEPLIKRREDMTGDLDQSLRNLWSIKWCLNLREYSVAIQDANTSEESGDTWRVEHRSSIYCDTGSVIHKHSCAFFIGLLNGALHGIWLFSIERETKYGIKETMIYVKVNYCPSVCFFGWGMVVIHTIWCLLSSSVKTIAKM